MLGTIPSAIKAMAQVTAQVAPVFKGGGAAVYGFTPPPVRTAGGNYSLTTDGNTNLVATANATVHPDYCIVQSLRNPGAGQGAVFENLITAANTVVVQCNVNGVLTDVDFSIIVLGIR